MAKLSVEEIEHIAKLARLELTPTEKKKYAEQISDILDYVKKLSEVDTKGVEPTSQVTGLENVMRDDYVICNIKNETKDKRNKYLFKNAPAIKDGQVKVKAVL